MHPSWCRISSITSINSNYGENSTSESSGGEVQAEFQHWRKAVAQRYPDKEMVEVGNVFGSDKSWLSCVELGWLEALLLEAEQKHRTPSKWRDPDIAVLRGFNHVMLPPFWLFLLWVAWRN